MRAQASTSSSITDIIPQTPILVDTTVGARTLDGEFINLTPEMDRCLIYFCPYISLLLSILPIYIFNGVIMNSYIHISFLGLSPIESFKIVSVLIVNVMRCIQIQCLLLMHTLLNVVILLGR
jgi:hypothetical protein